MSKVIKIPLIIILVLSCLVNALWLVIYFAAPDKSSLKIFNVGTLQGTEDNNGNKQSIIEVNSYKDCFEVKFNYYCNTETNDIYSSGIQIMTKEVLTSNDFYLPDTVFNFDYIFKRFNDLFINGIIFTTGLEKTTGSSAFWLGMVNNYYLTIPIVKTYYYNSDDNISYCSTTPLNENDGFYISIGEDRYIMKFKQDNFYNPYYYTVSSQSGFCNYTNYLKLDLMYFIEKLYNSVLNINTFTSGNITFEFGDLFDYYKETSPGVFSKDKEYDNEKIITLTKNYYNIKVNIHNTNIQRAEQSLFGQVGYNSNYYVSDILTANYYTGINTYVLNEKDFDYSFFTNPINSHTKVQYGYIMSIKEDLYNYIKSLKNVNVIIKINKNNLDEIGISPYIITSDSFHDLNILHIYEICNGEITEVFV